jgi:hypothetical protein
MVCQAALLVLTAIVAFEFVGFYRQILAGGRVTAYRPPGVEAYLPLGSVLAMRRWMQTGCWDEIHPAGLTFRVFERTRANATACSAFSRPFT